MALWCVVLYMDEDAMQGVKVSSERCGENFTEKGETMCKAVHTLPSGQRVFAPREVPRRRGVLLVPRRALRGDALGARAAGAPAAAGPGEAADGGRRPARGAVVGTTQRSRLGRFGVFLPGPWRLLAP